MEPSRRSPGARDEIAALQRSMRSWNRWACLPPAGLRRSKWPASRPPHPRLLANCPLAARRVTAELARKVQHVAARRARPERHDNALERRNLSKTRTHLADQFMFGDEQKGSAAALAEPPFEIPFIPNAGRHLPFDGSERVRADVVDERGKHLAIVAEQRPTRMRREHRPDLRSKLAPAPHAKQRVALRRQIEAKGSCRLAGREQQPSGGDVESDR